MRDCSGAFLTGDIASPALERLVIKPGTPLSELQRKLNHLAQEVFNARSKKQMHRQRHIVRQIDQYIAEHLSGDLSLTAIADALHFHPTYISRVYRECSSVSFSDSIAQSRLKKACTSSAKPTSPSPLLRSRRASIPPTILPDGSGNGWAAPRRSIGNVREIMRNTIS